MLLATYFAHVLCAALPVNPAWTAPVVPAARTLGSTIPWDPAATALLAAGSAQREDEFADDGSDDDSDELEGVDDVADLVLRRYSIRAFVGGEVFSDDGEDLVKWRLPVLGGDVFDGAGSEEGYEPFYDSWDVFERLAGAIGPELDHEGRLFEIVDGTTLELRASQAAHDRIAVELDALHAALDADAVLRVERFELERPVAGLVGGVVSAARAREIADSLAARSVVSVYEARATAFASRRIGGGSYERILREIDVEIATAAIALDAVYESVEIGPSALLRAAPCGNGWHVAALVSNRTVGRAVDAPVVGIYGTTVDGRRSEHGTFENWAFVESRCVATTLFLPTGRSAVLVESEARGGAVVTILTAVGGDPAIVRARPGGRLGVALDAAVRPRIGARRTDFEAVEPGARPLDADWDSAAVLRVAARADYPDRLFEMVGEVLERCEGTGEEFDPWMHLEPAMRHDPLYGTVDVGPDWTVGGRRAVDVLEDVVRSLAHPRANLVVEARLTVDGEETAAWSVPVVPGADAVFVVGTETLRVVDFGVEVADRSSVGDPVIEPVVDGTAFTIAVDPAGAGALSLRVDGSDQASRVEYDERARMLVDVVARTSMRFQELSGTKRVRVGEDGAYRASFGDLSGSGVRLDVTVRAVE